MEIIAILDTETTGLDPAKGQVLEIAVILYHIPTRSILAQASILCYAEDNAAYEINRIEVDALKKIEAGLQVAGFQMVRSMLAKADAIVAHNAEFDKKWMATLVDFQDLIINKQWICTRNDVIWPIRKGIPLNLIHICADLGVPIINAHRALSDCSMLLGAIECIEDIEFFLDKSGKGRVVYHANISYDKRQLVKEAGFMWDNEKKVWFAKLTPDQAATMPFTVYLAESVCLSS